MTARSLVRACQVSLCNKFRIYASGRHRPLREVRPLFRDHAGKPDLLCIHDQSKLEARGNTIAPFAVVA